VITAHWPRTVAGDKCGGYVITPIFLGALIGTLVFLPVRLLGRKVLVPFGIFLSLGAAVAWLWGPRIVAWYAASFLGA